MPALTFSVQLYVDNPALLPELEERMADLRPAFDEIIQKWARNNAEKFDAAAGKEQGGAEVDPDVFWEALTPAYIKGKRRAGFADQIMVRTGALKMALEDSDRFFQAETPQQVVFGTPQDEEDELKAFYNYQKRPVIFISLTDQKAIEATLKNYFSLGDNFKEIMFARGMAAVKAQQETAQMDVDFPDAVDNEE